MACLCIDLRYYFLRLLRSFGLMFMVYQSGSLLHTVSIGPESFCLCVKDTKVKKGRLDLFLDQNDEKILEKYTSCHLTSYSWSVMESAPIISLLCHAEKHIWYSAPNATTMLKCCISSTNVVGGVCGGSSCS